MIGSRFCLLGLGAVLVSGAARLDACSAPGAVGEGEAVALGSRLAVPDNPGSGPPAFGNNNITDIVHFHNLTPCPVFVTKINAMGGALETMALLPFEMRTGHMWVPWAANWNSGERMRISIANVDLYDIWQKGGRLAFRNVARNAGLSEREQRTTYDNAMSVPGLAAEGGERHIHVAMTEDGRAYFRIDGIPQ